MNKLLAEDFEGLNSLPASRQFHDTTVCITGATGFIGSYLTRFFLYLNDMHGANVTLHLDVRNVAKAQRMFGERRDVFYNSPYPEDFIFHCASPATPADNEKDFTGGVETNVVKTLSLLKRAKQHASQMVFISAGEVYGNAVSPISENEYGPIDPLLTRSNYAETKRVGENLCHSFHQKYGTCVFIPRLFHTYGIGIDLDDPRIFAKVVRSAVTGEPITLYSKEHIVRAFCYISDVVAGIFTILEKGNHGEAYNVGSDAATSIESLATYVSTKYDVPIQYGPVVGHTASPYRIMLPSCAKLRSLGWEPKVSLTDGFDRTIAYYKEEECAHMS